MKNSSTGLLLSCRVVPLTEAFGAVAATLAMGDGYRRCIPRWQCGRKLVPLGWRVGDKEREVQEAGCRKCDDPVVGILEGGVYVGGQ